MKTFASVATFLALAQAVMGQMTINTPGTGAVVECEPILLTWVGGVPNYYLSVITPGTLALVENLVSNTGANQYTWNVNLPSGQTVSFAVKDSTGAQAYTDSITIQPNPSGDTSCLSSSASGGATDSATGTGTATGGSATGSATGSGSGSATTKATGTGSATGSAASASGSGAASSATKATVGVFTLAMGLVGAALF